MYMSFERNPLVIARDTKIWCLFYFLLDIIPKYTILPSEVQNDR